MASLNTVRAPYGPDRLVFGEVDAQPPRGECEYGPGWPVACTDADCGAEWLGTAGEQCWACKDGRGEYV